MKPKAAHLIAVAGWGVAACACLEAWHQRQQAEALGERLLQELHHPAARQKITHGRHCACTSCASQDWTDPRLACCGMHGPDCPARYQPYRKQTSR